jgi:alpha-glucosidase
MPNSNFELETSQDPIGRKYAWAPGWLTKLLGLSLSRDGCRTPMHWSDRPAAGFSANPHVRTWLQISDTYKDINVAKERDDPDSLLACYKRLLALRKDSIALRHGSLEFIELADLKTKCLAYRRVHEEQELFIYLNFSEDQLELECPIEKPRLLFSTYASRVTLDIDSSDRILTLSPLEGVIFKK